MLHIMQTRNGTPAPDIVAMLQWAEANLDGRFLVVGVDKRLFDVHFPGQVNRYEVEERMRMRPFRFAVFSAADAETITAVSPAQIESVEVVPATSAHITDFRCNDFRRYHGVDADDGKITLAIVSSINEGLCGSLYEAVASRLNSLAGPTL
jgi:hypothetical protein